MAKTLAEFEAEIVGLVRDGGSVVLFVSAATNATPIVITTSVDHGRKTGDKVTITGVLGNTAANGKWTITVVDDDSFSLNTSVGNGAYTSGGVVYYRNGVLRVPADVDSAINRALEQYSRKRPLKKVADLTSDGTSEFDLAALEGFEEEFSGSPAIEYPISTSGEQNFIDRRDWGFVKKPNATVIRLMGVTTSTGDDVRFAYKAKHQVGTVPESDFFAVCKLGAAELCEQLARYYNQTSESGNLQGDVVNYQSKAQEYENRGKPLRKQFNDHIGAGDSTPAASVTKNWDLKDGVTHRRRDR